MYREEDEDAAPPRIILASGSPRRRELLGILGVPFEVVTSSSSEDPAPAPVEEPTAFAVRLAWQKAMDVAERYPDALVLAADTIVVLDGKVLGKPVDAVEATSMLKALRGRQHQVITGIAAVRLTTGLQRTTSDETSVSFRDYSEVEIGGYVAGGSPMDKAGAYGIQDAFQPASRVEGCYYNVMGLPLCLAARLLERADALVMLPKGIVMPEACRRADCGLL